MADNYRPAIADYFDELESRYGVQFAFDQLSDSELLEVERLGRHAIEEDARVTAEEKQALRPLLLLIGHQKEKRGLS